MKYPNLTKHGILVNFWLKLIYATIAKPSSETTQNREKEFLHYSSRKEGIEKHDKEASWNLSVEFIPFLLRMRARRKQFICLGLTFNLTLSLSLIHRSDISYIL